MGLRPHSLLRRLIRLRRRDLALGAGLATVATLLVLASSAAATSVTGVSFTPDSYVSANPSATWTIGFTTSGTGALATGNVVDVSFPSGFDVTGATAAFGTGFSGCTTPTVTVSGQVVVVPLTGAGCSLGATTAATLTITGLSATATQYSRTGFSVSTYTSAPFTGPIDGSGANPPSPIDILASVAYSTQTSAGGATTSGTAPTDASSPYSTGTPTVTVLGNTGSLALSGYTFAGWCTTNAAANPTLCTGTHYNANDTFSIAANTTLYSQWTAAGDGLETSAVSPGSVTASSTGNTLTFTYTAAAGGTNAGEVDVVVPSGWSAPTAAATAGCTTASTGTLAFSGQTIRVSALTLAGGGTLTVVYGATSGGSCTAGDGATAQSSTGTATFTTNEKSTAGGTLAPIASSPGVTVNALTCSNGYELSGGTCVAIATCAAGTYLSGGNCLSAIPGYFVAAAGATEETPCAPGTYSGSAGATECTPAPVGKYVSAPGAASYRACQAGFYSDTVGAAECKPAPKGSFVAVNSAREPSLCPAGSYSDSTGARFCTATPAGRYASGPGATEATLCAAGSYSDTAGAVACTPAPKGTYATGPGATSATLCAAGSYSDTAGAAACTPAPAGSFVSVAGATGSTPCPVDRFASGSGATTCDSCPLGQVTRGKTGQSACETVSSRFHGVHGVVLARAVCTANRVVTLQRRTIFQDVFHNIGSDRTSRFGEYDIRTTVVAGATYRVVVAERKATSTTLCAAATSGTLVDRGFVRRLAHAARAARAGADRRPAKKKPQPKVTTYTTTVTAQFEQ
ncbi:MAG TPA: hypothetical protein VFJ91_08495 [Gaiellaceae bacterium]|nr:hypothetical protein [Gaiellaceae bacterium]